MGIFKRLSDIISSNINDLLDRAENPSKMIKQIVQEMEEHVADLRTSATRAIATEKVLKKQIDEQRRSASDWEKKAVLALEKDKEELAHSAVEKKLEALEAVPGLEVHWESTKKTCEEMKENLKLLEEKLKIARRKQDALLATQRAAEARKEIQSTVGALRKSPDPFVKFEKMQRKVMHIEAESEAVEEMARSKKSVEVEFEIMRSQDDVKAELSRLKESIKKSSKK